MFIKGHILKGTVLDSETRCSHYHTELDRIAIKFYCCQTYFPCYLCHKESGCGETKVWPYDKLDKKAILYGACGEELTSKSYQNMEHKCSIPKVLLNNN